MAVRAEMLPVRINCSSSRRCLFCQFNMRVLAHATKLSGMRLNFKI